MPLFFQQPFDADTKLAIWKIEEEETFFNAHVPLQRSITHPHKRLQHLAGRYLLKTLFPHFPIALIRVADTRKPFLPDDLFHFSISHCGDFAAALVSRTRRVGVDIETVSQKIARVQHKFVSDDEREMLHAHFPMFNSEDEKGSGQPSAINSRLTLAWSCKEAAFKWHGLGEVDFKKHMELQQIETGDGKLFQTRMLFKKEEERSLALQSRFFDDLCLSYVVT